MPIHGGDNHAHFLDHIGIDCRVRGDAGLMPHARVEVVPGAWHHPWLADAPAVGRLVAGLVRRP